MQKYTRFDLLGSVRCRSWRCMAAVNARMQSLRALSIRAHADEPRSKSAQQTSNAPAKSRRKDTPAPRGRIKRSMQADAEAAAKVMSPAEDAEIDDSVASLDEEEPASVKKRRARVPSQASKPRPKVLVLHTGGTLGMDTEKSFIVEEGGDLSLKEGTGGSYPSALRPGTMLNNLLEQVPELAEFADLGLRVVFNKDSSRMGPADWIKIAGVLDANRQLYDAFLVVHGTDTLAYTASALSLMLQGFRKPIVLTGSQLPLASPRSDARQNLIDSLTCATASFHPPHVALQEVAVCFGGQLMRGNRARKVNSSSYQAFDSPTYPKLATLGIDVDWNERYMLKVEGGYVPRLKLEASVLRVPIVPGVDPRAAYGDLAARGVKGVVLEVFGVGNMPDAPNQGWLPWLKTQTAQGLQVYLLSQCGCGPLHPELYRSGALALALGVEAGPLMTPECAVVKMMLRLAHPDIPLSVPLAGEL